MKRNGWQKTWIRTITTLLTVSVMIMIFCFSMENSAESDQRSGEISMIFIRLFYPEYGQMEAASQKELYDRIQFAIRKGAHFTEYLILGFMIRLCFESWFGSKITRPHPVLFICFTAGLLYACTDEIHQMAIDGRNGAWTDVMVDGAGVLAGVWICGKMISALNRKHAKHLLSETD